MQKIASFQVDHTNLKPGIYLSRTDGDITTYDIRFKRPNKDDYLKNPAIHTTEHLFATYARNSKFAENIVYFGPMGCLTGYYFLTRNLLHADAIELIKGTVRFISAYDGDIPGASEIECGNWLCHDLPGAKRDAAEYLAHIECWTADMLAY